MPGTDELLGGLFQGFVGAKNQSKQLAILDEYRKSQTELIKAQAKHETAKVDLEAKKMSIFAPILEQAMSGGGAQAPAAPAAPMQPQVVPQAYSQGGTQPLPQVIAQKRTSDLLNPTGGQTPIPAGGGLVEMSPEGQKSYRNQTVYNIKWSPWQAEFGGQPGEGGFTKFPNIESSVAAAVNLIKRDYANLSIRDGIERFAPTKLNNPTTPQRIVETARALGVTPDTKIGDLPLGPFMEIQAKYESPTKINPAIWGEYRNVPINQVPFKPSLQLGQTQTQTQAQAQPQVQVFTAQTNPQQFQPIRSITQKDALNAAWKFFSGVDLKDEKFDYRIDKEGNIRVLKDGQQVNIIDGGPNISWHNLPNGGFIALDAKTRQPVAAIPIPEMVKTKGQTRSGVEYEAWTPKGGAFPQPNVGGQPAVPGLTLQGNLDTGIPPGAIVTQYPKHELPGTAPESVRTKYGENQAIIDQLNILQQTYKPEYLGLKGAYSSAKNTASGVPGLEGLGDSGFKTFRQIYDEMLGQKLHQRGGSALTQQEIMYIKNTLPQLGQSPELFKSGVEAAKLLLQISNYEMMAAQLTPDKAKYEQAALGLRDQYFKTYKPKIEKGVEGLKAAPPGAAPNPMLNAPAAPNFRFNPSTGKLDPVQ